MPRIVLLRQHDLLNAGETASYPQHVGGRLVQSGLAVWHPEDAPALPDVDDGTASAENPPVQPAISLPADMGDTQTEAPAAQPA